MKKYHLLLLLIALVIVQNVNAQTPVAYYPFSGNANDAAGSNNGTVNGATLTTDRFGNANSAYSFDGVGDNISINNSATFNFPNSLTISLWVKYNGVGTAGKSIWSLISKNFNGNGNEDQFHLWVNATDKSTGGRFGTGPDLVGFGGLPAIDNGLWHQIQVVFDNPNNIINHYLDGVLISTAANTANVFNNGSAIKIGYWEAFNNFFNGAIDEVKIYNTALTAAQVQNEYTSSAPVPAIYSSQLNNSVQMNGANDYIDCGNNAAYNITSSLTIEAWIKPTSFGILRQIVHKGGIVGNTDRDGFQLRIDGGTSAAIVIANATSFDATNIIFSNSDLNKWIHIAGVYDGSTLKIYRNGVLASSKITTQTLTHNSQALLIGRRIDGFNFDGSMDEVRLWNTARTQAEIVANMNSQIAGTEAGLVGYWDMNRNGQGAGLTVDNKCVATGAALNGTTVGTTSTPIFAPDVTQQKPGSGNAISFDGVDDVIDIPSNTANNFTLNQNFTIECWAKIPSSVQPNEATESANSLVEKWDGVTGGYPYVIRYRNNNPANVASVRNKIEVARWNGTNYVPFHSSVSVNDDKFHHISATKNGSLLSLYIDGVLQSTATDLSSGQTDNPDPLHIGGRTSANPLPFNGIVDEIRIWNTALSQAQIRDRMCRKITADDALYPNLVAYYNFDESAGTTAFDGTINANNGTLTNNPTRVTSGAHIGNTSAHTYAGAASSATLAHPTRGDNLTATLTSGTADGIQLYCVTEVPNTTNGQAAIPNNNGYFGVFPINGTANQYTATYDYTGITGIVNENGLKLFKRTDNAATTWANSNAVLNTVANTLIATGQNTEYMVGETTAPKVTLSGALTGDYQTLKEALDAINIGGGSGGVTVTVVDNTIETAQAVLNQTNYTINIIPQGNRIIECNLNTPLLLLNGADNVTIDGQTLTGANTLTLRNTNAGASAGVIRLLDAANNNTLKKCTLEAAITGTTVSQAVIAINVNSIGNSVGNIIDSNYIKRSGAGGITAGVILAALSTAATSTITNTQITNNSFENVFANNISSFVIIAQTNCNNTLVKGNSIYNTIPINNTTNALVYYGIALFNTGNTIGSGINIDSNYIGGAQPLASGGNFTINSPNNSINTRAIFVQDNTTNISRVTKNVIRNFSIDVGNPTVSTANPFIGIQVSSGNLARLDSNTIGNTSNNSINLTFRPSNTGQTGGFGILTSVACTNPITNNFFGGISITSNPTVGASGTPFFNVLDTRATTANVNIKNNIIGSATNNNISVTNNLTPLFSFTGISISQLGANIAINVDSNIIRNNNLTGSAVSVIRNSYSSAATTTSSFTMNANNITNVSTTGVGISLSGLNYSNASVATANNQIVSINNNVVNNLNINSGTDAFLRAFTINNLASNLNVRMRGRITGNTISLVNNQATGAGGQTLGINVVQDVLATDSIVIANNSVNNIQDAGSSAVTTIRGSNTAISVEAPLSNSFSATPGLVVVRDNQINGVQSISTLNAAIRTQGIAVFGNKTVIERNKIFNLSNAATSSNATIVPLYLDTRVDDLNNFSLVSNNMVVINNTTIATQRGITMGTGTLRSNIYHNTILVEGISSTNSYAFFKPSTAQADVKNNILYNATIGSGNGYAIGLATNANGYTGNNNYFVTPQTNSLAEIGITSHNLSSWQTATVQDAATRQNQSGVTTIAANLFLDKANGNLLINTSSPNEPLQLSNQGMPLSAVVPTDYLGTTRSTTVPDIGAHEFVYATLPLSLLNFNGAKQNANAQLQWRTSNEVNISRFELQRTSDLQPFTTIATILGGVSSYNYTDIGIFNTKATVFYRLKIIDKDGAFKFSNVIKLTQQQIDLLTIYPNPAIDVVTISGLKQGGILYLFNAEGKLLQQQKVTNHTTRLRIGNYNKGIYLLQYKNGNEAITQKIIKQ